MAARMMLDGEDRGCRETDGLWDGLWERVEELRYWLFLALFLNFRNQRWTRYAWSLDSKLHEKGKRSG